MFLTQAYIRRNALGSEEIYNYLYDLDGEHKLVWRLFADHPDRDRDFIYNRLTEASIPTFIMISHRKPVDKNENWQLKTVAYDPEVNEGDTIHFSLKANPTVKRNGNRHDIVMDAIKQLEDDGVAPEDIPPRGKIAQKTGQLWLLQRQEQYGYKLIGNRLKIDNYRQHNFRKARNNRHIKLSSLDFTGLMEVTNSEKFRQTLFNGLGPSKAYGFGCLLVKKLEPESTKLKKEYAV